MKLSFFGDTVISENTGLSLSQELCQVIQESDFNIINFEGSLRTETSSPIKKIGPNVSNSKECITSLKQLGFNVLTLANNHIADFGLEGFNETLKEIQNHNLLFCGAGNSYEQAYKPLVLEKNGEKIALINACHAEFGVFKDKEISLNCGYAWINNFEIKKNISECKNQGCFVIVLPHAGVEFMPCPLPEWRSLYKEFILAGADLVIGGHPHTVQGKETFQNKIIYYSIGNFSFYNHSKEDDKDWNSGLVVTVDTKNYSFSECFIENSKHSVRVNSSSISENSFRQRSILLSNQKEYIETVDYLVRNLWFETYKPLYDAVPNFINCRKHLLLNLIKYFAKKYIFRSKFQKNLNEDLLLHNIQIESHRYAVERYLYKMNCKKNNFLK